MDLSSRSVLSRYGPVPLLVAAALLVRFLLWQVLGAEIPFLFLWPAIVVAAWYGGLGPGILTTVLAALVGLFLFSEPGGSVEKVTAADWLGVVLFVGLGLAISALLELLHRARARVEANAREISRQREQFRVTLLSIGDGLITTDAAGRVTLMNDVAQVLTGWKRDEAVGRPFEEVFRIVHEQTRQPAANPVAQALGTGQVVGLANHTVLISRSETEVPIDDSAAPIRDAFGEITGVVMVFRDVSERQRAEEVRSRLAAIVESCDDAIIGTSPDGHVTSWNRGAERLYGYAAAEVRGRQVSLLMPTDRRDEWPRMLETLRRGERVEPFDTVRLRKDGSRVDVSVTVSPVKDESGRVIGLAAIARDITERKLADRRKDEFLAMLGHELRNPLAALQSAAELFGVKEAGAAQVVWAQGVVGRQVRHLARLVDDLMDLGRINRGDIRLRPERVELAEVVERAVEISRPHLAARRQELSEALPAGPVWLEADGDRLAQVLANLLNNAAKYTPEGGHIWLAAEAREGEVAIRVRDNGMGIAPEMLPHVFDLFAQAERTLDRSDGGLGIGLSLVKKLVEAHGGAVTAHSDGPGQGSEFVVRLPVAAGSPPPARDGTTAPRRPPSCRVLLVDDNTDAVECLAILLQTQGHEVRTAADGPAALREAAAFRPEVVILDLGLPGMDGLEVARQLRQAGPVRLVALTGYAHEDDVRRAREAGFDAHLVKPVDLATLEPLLAVPAPAAK
jgi:PAS domain S-box-containing protein